MTQPASTQVREKDNSMENANAHLGIHEHLEIVSEEGAAQEFEKILSTGLPSLYRNAHRLLGNSADAEDAVQDALLAAYMLKVPSVVALNTFNRSVTHMTHHLGSTL